MSETKEKGHLITSQRQTINKLIEKKRQRKEIPTRLETYFFVKCRFKNIKSSLRETKKNLPDLISSQQTTNVTKQTYWLKQTINI